MVTFCFQPCPQMMRSLINSMQGFYWYWRRRSNQTFLVTTHWFCGVFDSPKIVKQKDFLSHCWVVLAYALHRRKYYLTALPWWGTNHQTITVAGRWPCWTLGVSFFASWEDDQLTVVEIIPNRSWHSSGRYIHFPWHNYILNRLY